MNKQINQAKKNFQAEKVLDEETIVPPHDSILATLDIDPTTLKFIKNSWTRTHYRAVVNWLIKYKPQLDASNLQIVRGCLEAFQHLCEVGNWERACDIICINLNTPTNEQLHTQLETWGYEHQRIELYSKTLGKVDLDWDSLCLNGLGNDYISLGDYPRAMDYHQQQLVIARQKNDYSR